MKNTILIIGILLVLFSAYGIYKEFNKPKLDNEADKGTVAENMRETLSEKEQAKQLLSEKSTPEDFEKFRSELDEKYSEPESAVDYLVSIAMMEDTNNYADAFIPKTFSKDIYGQTEPNKVKLIERIMDRFTRSGSLEKVDYIDIKWTTSKRTVRVITDLYYKDLQQPIRTSITVEKKEQKNNHAEEHAHAETDFFYIKTSIWEMIDTIERGVAKQ